MENYCFGPFILNEGQILYRQQQIVNVPPKELAVLKLLLIQAGKLVLKENIINEVWDSEDVADESLTRCVYVLRKILGDKPTCRYIETIYGKGYRFVMAVNKEKSTNPGITEDAATSKLVAVFPFKMADKEKSLVIFDYINSMGDIFYRQGFMFMPSAMTVDSDNISSHFTLLKEAGASYFLTGLEIKTNHEQVIRLELIRSSTLKVISRGSVIISVDSTLNLINFNNAINSMLEKTALERKSFISSVVDISNKSCEIAKNYNSYSIFQFENFKHADKLSLNLMDYETPTLCNLAGCYLALAMLGIMNYEKAEDIIRIITDKVIALEPNNALAVSMRALMISPSEGQNESEFHLAMILSPLSAEVYYYYACYLVRQQELNKAQRLITMASSLNPGFFAAQILCVVVKAISGDSEGAIMYAQRLKGKDESCDIIINSLLIVLYNRTGARQKALEIIEKIKGYRDRCAFVSCVYNSVMNEKKDKKTVMSNLKGISNHSLSRQSVYWLPFFDEAASYR